MSHRLAFAGLALLAAAGPAAAQSRFERESVASDGTEGNQQSPYRTVAFSADGRWIAFDSPASNLAPWDQNNTIDVFVHDRTSGATLLVSVALTGLSGDSNSELGGMSADGRFITFLSYADNLVKYDTNHYGDVFVRDRDPDGNGVFDEGNETTTRVNVAGDGSQANNFSYLPAISADGTTIAYASDATDLVAGDANGASDVFVYDVATGTTAIASLNNSGVQGNSSSYQPHLSGDGQLVCFVSSSTNLVKKDLNQRSDVFVRDRAAGATERESVRTDLGESNGDVYDVSFSDDGRFVAFSSYATNLVDGDTNNDMDVFLRDRAAATTIRVDVTPQGTQADHGAYAPFLAPSGSSLIFGSAATDIAGTETNHTGDVFQTDLATFVTRKVSTHPSGIEGANGSYGYAVSNDGQLVALVAYGFDLIGSDANSVLDLLVRDYAVGDPIAAWENYGAGWPGALGVPGLVPSANPVMGTTIDLELGNSTATFTVGILVVGAQRASLVTNRDGTLLVAPTLYEPLLIHPGGTALTATVPLDDQFGGLEIDLQLLDVDAAASRGASFSEGLALTLGQ
jgi:Tol biopolymer transport system component